MELVDLISIGNMRCKIFEFLTINTKLPMLSKLASKVSTKEKKLQWG